MKKVNILIVDDDALTRDGIRALLEKEEFVDIIYEANDEKTFSYAINSNVVDIILLDLKIEGTSGLKLFRTLSNIEKRPNVIAVTGLGGKDVILNMLKAGVNGAVSKLDGYAEIEKAIVNVPLIGSYFSPRVRKIIHDNQNHWDEVRPVLLSHQEKDFLQALERGLSAKQIAHLFEISEGYSKKIKIKLLRKIGVNTSVELLAFAYRNGIL